ncbi:Dihydrolipoamide acetyltransferase component of pyruvate dehydrogenase complex [Frankia canadensis]|uniref:Dihydrolipoamide acetyltransferase component of pyruvate dehydrogenase complex n=1 Tax=Frankia canadensis TaxID=1836972 RepID=A0A2I2KXP3_9ACTN|nr:dihydrolipoamide acetyltransferase family protein [Frankia canadensis]SNQ50431.1 Dihydrolipoamide acetyltransferase component of pyruvate dehydrogenase complex [Frankia canadensis]SOU57721.1 Dihydrolipoamide acetyltransferase component of pyruvate dehydrogenase complex [Frankia canadensis]
MAPVRAFALPDLGEGLTSAEIVRWLVEVGDVITIDQPVAEVETAKAVVEVPCPYAGVVTALAGPAGTTVPVGTPLIAVSAGEPGDVEAVVSSAAISSAAATTEPSPRAGNILVGYGPAEPELPRSRRRRPTPAPAPAPGAGSGRIPAPRDEAAPSGPHAAPPRPGSRAAGSVAVVSPLVRRLARDHGVDLRTLRGSGPGGLITRRDVQTSITGAVPGTDAGPGTGTSLDGEVEAFDAVRRRAARAFSRSRGEVPDATCWVDADATALLAARDTLNAGGAEVRIGVLALLARMCVAALLRAPELNSSVVTDASGQASGLRRHGAVHLGFAAQTPRGLAVPVVRDAHRRDTAGLAAEIARLTAAARAGRLTPAELTGGTFTLNNYGVFGVDGAAPIINHPETSMLGVGRIVPRPWVVDGALAVRRVVQLSFTFDHRVCDGATAGAFLRFVADAVEDPTALLRHL